MLEIKNAYVLDEKTVKELQAFAKITGKSEKSIIKKAIKEYLEELEDQILIKERIKSLNKEELVSHEEIKRKYLGN